MKGELLWIFKKGLSHIHANNNLHLYSHFLSVMEFKMLYKYEVIRSFLLFLSMSDVLYYYPHYIEREMRE